MILFGILGKASEEGGAPLPIFLVIGQLKPFIYNDLLDGPHKSRS
jgi:hypothetical protein